MNEAPPARAFYGWLLTFFFLYLLSLFRITRAITLLRKLENSNPVRFVHVIRGLWKSFPERLTMACSGLAKAFSSAGLRRPGLPGLSELPGRLVSRTSPAFNVKRNASTEAADDGTYAKCKCRFFLHIHSHHVFLILFRHPSIVPWRSGNYTLGSPSVGRNDALHDIFLWYVQRNWPKSQWNF